MTKQQMLAEIQRIAVDHGGRAPGAQVFERQTGERLDWYPHMWLRWGDA